MLCWLHDGLQTQAQAAHSICVQLLLGKVLGGESPKGPKAQPELKNSLYDFAKDLLNVL